MKLNYQLNKLKLINKNNLWMNNIKRVIITFNINKKEKIKKQEKTMENRDDI